MQPHINFVELENRVISATYRSLMIGAKIQLVETATGRPLPEPVFTVTSPIPSGSFRMSLPALVTAGEYFLRVLNGHGKIAARSAVFRVP